jgi:hypothetical protein
MTYLPPWLKIVFICTPHLGSPLAAGLLGRFGRDLIFAPVELMKSVDNLAATPIATALRKKGRIFQQARVRFPPSLRYCKSRTYDAGVSMGAE